ncbi:MAG: molybdopterin biosynthesis protein [Syntrophomonadaceae bacterium]|jgi:putative molybdopterin biosynthesis protein|nr:molybdopterin biosynthesis protein [Syntrophomonadaceae bacterium]
MARKVYIENMPLDQALDLVMNRLQSVVEFRIEEEEIEVQQSLGRITAEPIRARKSSPHYPASAMDGIAVRARDTLGASETTPVLLYRDQHFVEVDTGDPVPGEYDAVIMIEDVNYKDENTAEIIAPAVPWQHVRSVGEDLIASQIIIPAFFPVGPFEIGSLLTAGVTRIKVVKKPRVAIIPTGTEIVEPGQEKMRPGEVTESNSRMLSGLCEVWGGLPIRQPPVPDDREVLKEAIIKAAPEADMIVICSGSSAGREDYTAEVIEETGELILHGLAIKPGKPAIVGLIDRKPVLGIPGYPVSAALVFELIGRPLIYALQGITPPEPQILEARVARKLASSMGVDEFIHVTLARVGSDYMAFPRARGAGATSSLVKTDGILVVPRGLEGHQPGDRVHIRLTRPLEVVDRTIMAIGSHDLALDYLGNVLWKKHRLRLASTNVGSMGGIMALRRGETHLAGIHLLDTATGEYNISYLERYLKGEKLVLINLVTREQGLMVKAGNPLGIKSLADLTRPEIRFVNRQKGAGTRILLDYLLKNMEIDPAQINGYGREEFSHLAVAAAVSNDTADVSLGIYASAQALGLDFIPVESERYDLCIAEDLVETSVLEALYQAIADPEFVSATLSYGGYNLDMSGQVVWRSG